MTPNLCLITFTVCFMHIIVIIIIIIMTMNLFPLAYIYEPNQHMIILTLFVYFSACKNFGNYNMMTLHMNIITSIILVVCI